VADALDDLLESGRLRWEDLSAFARDPATAPELRQQAWALLATEVQVMRAFQAMPEAAVERQAGPDVLAADRDLEAPPPDHP